MEAAALSLAKPLPGQDAKAHDCFRYLPETWRDSVESPLYVTEFREYEIDARRCVGYDADDQPCYTAHHYVLGTDQPGRPAVYAEEMAAWRLRDDRWLVFRIIGVGTSALPRGFYVISPEMPR